MRSKTRTTITIRKYESTVLRRSLVKDAFDDTEEEPESVQAGDSTQKIDNGTVQRIGQGDDDLDLSTLAQETS